MSSESHNYDGWHRRRRKEAAFTQTPPFLPLHLERVSSAVSTRSIDTKESSSTTNNSTRRRRYDLESSGSGGRNRRKSIHYFSPVVLGAALLLAGCCSAFHQPALLSSFSQQHYGGQLNPHTVVPRISFTTMKVRVSKGMR